MTDATADAPLDPSAYAPYRNPRDYILSWTDVIWIEKALGRLDEHYDANIQVHTAYGETYDYTNVIANSVQKMHAFPNGGGGSGEDVIWEQRGPNGFISSHRVFKTGTHSGHWTYGAPTGRDWVSRTIAHCTVANSKIVEEWLIRDEFAVLQSLGIDPYQMAEAIALRSPVTGQPLALPIRSGPFGGDYPDPTTRGISGVRPNRFLEECEAIISMYHDVWNSRRFDLVSTYCDPKVVCHTVRMKRHQGIDSYQNSVIDLLAAVPDGQIEVRDIVVNESDELGTRIAVIWVMHGTYSGVPAYGTVTNTPVKLLGGTHLEMRDGRILREWRLFDEIALIAQIAAGRRTL